MNENIEHVKNVVSKKQQTHKKLVLRNAKLGTYIDQQLAAQEINNEDIARNEADLARMDRVLAGVLAVEEEYTALQMDLNRMNYEDTWKFGDPQSEKLDNNPVFAAKLERFLSIGEDLLKAKSTINKIYYRR